MSETLTLSSSDSEWPWPREAVDEYESSVEALTGKVCGGQAPDRLGAGEVKG